MDKPRIAIFDLTDCEGCELQFLGLQEKLLDFTQDYEIANWRLVQPSNDLPEVDVAIIQGTVMTQNDLRLIKKVRENSKILVAIGECARTGWIPSWIKKDERSKAISYVYGKDYQAKATEAMPIKSVIKVDLEIPGCPPELKVLEDFLEKIPSLVKDNNAS